jgi:phage FluMu protein Com
MFASVRSSVATAIRDYSRTVRCRKCRGPVDLSKHLAGVPAHRKAWRLDTRQTLVRCPKCKTFSKVFVYPLFNHVPPMRAVAEAATLSALSLALLALAR